MAVHLEVFAAAEIRPLEEGHRHLDTRPTTVYALAMVADHSPPSPQWRNPHPERVRDPLFARHPAFFDPEDIVQVKYEMLRAHHVDDLPVTEASLRFGVSRQTFYTAQSAFRTRRLAGLLPSPPGPKRPRKVTPDIEAFLRSRHRDSPELGWRELTSAVADQFGVSIHPRTVKRLLGKKKRRSPARRPHKADPLPSTGGPPATQL